MLKTDRPSINLSKNIAATVFDNEVPNLSFNKKALTASPALPGVAVKV